MRRGDIVLIDLDPADGAAGARLRAAVVVSNDGANAAAARLGWGVVTVVPVTSNVTRAFPFQVVLAARDCGLAEDSKAQAEQVRSIAAERVGRTLGRVPEALMRRLDESLRLHLAL